MIFRHRLKARDVELGKQPLQSVATLASERNLIDAALAIIAGVEHDHAAVFHVGVDLGDDGIGQRLRRIEHRPVQHRIKRDLVFSDIDTKGLAGLNRSAGGEHFAKANETGAADVVGFFIAR